MKQGAIRTVKNVVSEIELWSGVQFSIEAVKYTSNPNVVGAGDGVQTPEDWTNSRRKGSQGRGTDGSELDTDEKYLRYILGVESINLIGVLSLAKIFDFSRYNSIFEIGCGDMAQAYAIHHLYPHIRYVATDFDPYVIDRCSHLRALDGIDKRVLNVIEISDETIPFAGFELLTSWGMEYAIDDDQLLRLLRLAKRSGVTYLMCSATTIGVLEYLRSLLAHRKTQDLVERKKLRRDGWLRSAGRIRRLAAQAGMTMEVLGRFGYHFCTVLHPAGKLN